MNAPSRNQQIKEASRFLRGGIARGLAKAETGALGEDDAQLTGTYLQDHRDLRQERRLAEPRAEQRAYGPSGPSRPRLSESPWQERKP